jgi:xylan 1,4-beta-xylosidase
MQSLVDRFGRDAVRRWRVRVGTEPDLYPGHWSGTREDYLRHYDHTVAAVCRVIPDADIGPGNILNPGVHSSTPSQRDQWGLDIIDHAATGRNHVTGNQGTPLRHFSCSWYGKIGQPIDSFDVAITRMRQRLDRYPHFTNVPVEVAEFSVLTDERGRRLHSGDSTQWSASWYAAVAQRVYALNVAQVHNWGYAWNDFHYPRAHVMTLLERMEGGQRLDCSAKGSSQARCGAIACRKDDRLFVLIFNHRPLRSPEIAERVALTIRDSAVSVDQSWTLSQWEIDAEHSTFIHAFHADCEAAGLVADDSFPQYGCGGRMFERYGPASRELFSRHREKYLALSRLAQTKDQVPIAVGDGHFRLAMDLPGHSVRLLRFEKQAD